MASSTQSRTAQENVRTGAEETISQSVRNFCDQIQSFASSAGFKGIHSLLRENTNLRQELDLKASDIVKLRQGKEEAAQDKQKVISELLVINRKEVSEKDRLSNRISSLETSLDEKNALVAEKESNINDTRKQISGLQQSCTKETQKVAQANREIDSFQKNIKEKDNIIDRMKEAESKSKGQLKSSRDVISKLTEDNKVLKQSLRTVQERVQHFESLTAGYHKEDENNMTERFAELWEYSKRKLYPYLQTDFPEAIFKENQPAWNRFKERSLQDLRYNMPLPSSNSRVAKLMRFVTVLAIFARQIDRYLFQPAYILPEGSHLREMLAELAAGDSEKESLCRSILISVDPVTQNSERDDRIKTLVRNVSSCLYGLLPEPQLSGFQSELETIARKSADTWEPLRRSKKKYESDFEPLKWRDMECKFFIFPDDDTPKEEGPLDQDSLIVFPRVSIVENNERSPCTYAIQFRKTSHYFVSAYQESIQQTSSPGAERTALARTRRRSTTSNAATERNSIFLGGRTLSRE